EYLAKAKAAGFESPESRLAYALILADKGRYAEALEIYDQISATEPGNAAAWYQKGAVLAKSGDLDKAVAAYRQAVALEPTLAAAWF
ncbi:tetratricopeptide repeat protein, partial [Escherichia coli]|nr:tetratricopeptide repeat protein [Escherichia coli]